MADTMYRICLPVENSLLKECMNCLTQNMQTFKPTQARKQIWQLFFTYQPGDTVLSLELAHGGHLNTGIHSASQDSFII